MGLGKRSLFLKIGSIGRSAANICEGDELEIHTFQQGQGIEGHVEGGVENMADDRAIVIGAELEERGWGVVNFFDEFPVHGNFRRFSRLNVPAKEAPLPWEADLGVVVTHLQKEVPVVVEDGDRRLDWVHGRGRGEVWLGRYSMR